MNLLKRIFLGPEETSLPVYAHTSWTVRWQSRHNEYSSGTRPEAEVFPIKQDAEDFKQALEQAFKLIRYTSGTRVTIEENK